MDSSPEKKNSVNLWLAGLVAILTLVSAGQGWLLYNANKAGRLSLGTFMESRIFRPGAPVPPFDTPPMLVEPSEEIQQIHAQIRQLFEQSIKSSETVGRVRLPPLLPDRHVSTLQNEINRIFEDAFRQMEPVNLPHRLNHGWDALETSSAMNIEEQDTNYVVSISLPGIDKSAVSVSIQGRLITLTVNPPTPNPTTAHPSIPNANHRGRHMQTKILMTGPVNGDTAQALFENGILHIIVPKGEDKEPLAKTLRVQ